MNNIKKQKGFSLVELLFVVVIILVLGGISIIALNGQRAKARDAKRINDVRQIKTALEFYYSDEGEYPVLANPITLGPQGAVKLCSKFEGSFVVADTECELETTYMSQIPNDPLNNQQFIYTGTTEGYDIKFFTEKETIYGPAGEYHAHSESIDRTPGNR